MTNQPKVTLKFVSVNVSHNRKKGAKERIDRSEVQGINDGSISLMRGDRVYIDPALHQERISTLFKLIIGTLKPVSGTVKAEGDLIVGPNSGFGILPKATLEENLTLRALKLGHTIASAKAYKTKILSVANFSDYRYFPFGELTKDMKSMVLAESLAHVHPSILVMDGWMTASSKVFTSTLKKNLVKLIDNSEIALVAVNRPELVLSLCTHRLDFTDMGGISLTEL